MSIEKLHMIVISDRLIGNEFIRMMLLVFHSFRRCSWPIVRASNLDHAPNADHFRTRSA